MAQNSHVLAKSGFVKNVRVDLRGRMVQLYGEVVTGDRFYFRARYGLISLEIRSGDEDGNKPVRTFLTTFHYDRGDVNQMMGAGSELKADQAAIMVFTWLSGFVPTRKARLRRPAEFNRKLYKLTLKQEPFSEDVATAMGDSAETQAGATTEPSGETGAKATHVSTRSRIECALSGLTMGLALVTHNGPDDSVLFECHPVHSACLKVLPHVINVTEVGDEALMPQSFDEVDATPATPE